MGVDPEKLNGESQNGIEDDPANVERLLMGLLSSLLQEQDNEGGK